MELQKAIIAELHGDDERNPFPVQFNPTTLHLALSNRVEGNQSQGRQVRQFVGPSSTTLTADLIFDSADEGSSSDPVSVRDKTRKLEVFVVSRDSGNGGSQQSTPPRIRFSWGDLIVEGVVNSLSVDFDHFAANGVPLRAKVALSIQGQDRKREVQASSDARRGAPPPGSSSAAGPGGGASLSFGAGLSLGAGLGISAGAGLSLGIGASVNVGLALGGESAADFAVRAGVDPSAWRGLDFGGESSLSLSAGATISFSAGLTASAGLGTTPGVSASATDSLESNLGLAPKGGSGARTSAGNATERLATGFSLANAGGLGSAIETVQQSKNASAEQQSRDAFQTPPRPAPVGSAPGANPSAAATAASLPAALRAQDRAPLRTTDLPSTSSSRPATNAPPPPRADTRSSTFGFGVPLRPALGGAASDRSATLSGSAPPRSRRRSGSPPIATDGVTPPWVALPSRDPGRARADDASARNAPPRCCGDDDLH